MHHAGSAEARSVRLVEDSRAHVAGIAICVIQKGSQLLRQLLAQRAGQSAEIRIRRRMASISSLSGRLRKNSSKANDPLMEWVGAVSRSRSCNASCSVAVWSVALTST